MGGSTLPSVGEEDTVGGRQVGCMDARFGSWDSYGHVATCS